MKKTINTKLYVKGVTIDEGKVSHINLDYGGSRYFVDVNNSKMSISKLYAGPVGVYDSARKKMQWYSEHVCGTTGFGQSSDDHCSACDSPKGYSESYKNKNITDFSRASELMHPVSLPLIVEQLCKNLESGLADVTKPIELQLAKQKTLKTTFPLPISLKKLLK